MSGLIQKIKNKLFPEDRYKFFIKDWKPLFDLSISEQVLNTKRFSQNLKPTIIESLDSKKVLLLSPHPDDDAFGCAGTLIKFQKNLDISTVYITDAGDTDEDIDKLKAEAENVSKALRSTPFFLHHEPGKIPIEDKQLTQLISDFKPDIIFTTFMLDDHDDHRRVNHLLSNSLKESTFDGDVWSYQIYSTVIPNVVVNITEEIDRKYEVMNLYKTIYGQRDWPHYVKGLNAANCRFLRGRENKYAETFFVVPVKEYLKLTELYFSNEPDLLYYKSYRT